MLSLLKEPDCGLVENVQIDHGYIGVLPAGTCFNIPQKKFELRPQMNATPRRTLCHFRRGSLVTSYLITILQIHKHRLFYAITSNPWYIMIELSIFYLYFNLLK